MRRAEENRARVLLVVSCEHGGNRVPVRYRHLFTGAQRALASHLGWDPGALDLARNIARACRAPLVATTTTRLLVECNRSPGHPRLFSEFTRSLPRKEKELILARHYAPHRHAVEETVRRAMRGGRIVIHVGVHTFTSVLDGRRRDFDVGLLYDPHRAHEVIFCELWMRALARWAPRLRARRNLPYRGWSDGLTTTLRPRFPSARYAGIELEVNQALVAASRWPDIRRSVAGSLRAVISG